MKKSEIIIREALLPNDFQEVIFLWQSSGPGIQLGESDSLKEIEKKVFRDPDLFLVAEWGGRIVGSVLGGFDGRRGMVYHLAVSNHYQKNGIGEILMAELEARLQKKGCLRSYLLVTKENSEAKDFYSKRGWKELNLCVMGKDI